MRKPVFCLASLLIFSAAAAAQQSPFLPEDLYRKLVNEISGDIAYDHLRTLTQFHSPNGASRGFRAEAQWIASKAKEAGLEDVRILDLAYDGTPWSPLGGELWLIETGKDGKATERKLGSYAEVATSIADFSRPAKTEAELVDVGTGIDPHEYEGKDVRGKIVLASGNPSAVESEAVWTRGALGIVSYYSSRANPADYPDQIAWSRIHQKAGKEGKEPAFAFMVSWRTGTELKRRLNPRRVPDPAHPGEFKEEPAETLRVRVNIESEINGAEQKQQIVEGWIRGSRTHDQQVVLTAHIQEEKTSANDDRSGCANLLEVARALVTMINQGKLPRPERDIRFWWANEISAEYQYFADHPEERKNIFVDINQDMVGVNSTIGGLSRVQHVALTPWSRATFFTDVVESVVTSLRQGNNAYLAAMQAESVTPGETYSRPIFSRLGSRDRYSIEIVPYFDSTDHLVFDDAFIAATHGGITFTNWPDEYIHSSDDDMWQMDRTMFKRNGVAVAALAWYMANVGARDVNALGAVFLPNGFRRIYRDIASASAAQVSGGASDWDVQNVAAQAIARELAAAESLKTVAPGDANVAAQVDRFRQRFSLSLSTISEALAQRPNPQVTPVAAMASRVPRRIESLADYLKNRREMKSVPDLHALMAYEALNFADGRRTMWDVYEAVRAESLAAGEWYYGKVTPEMIQQYFENAAAAGIVTIAEAKPAPATPAKLGR